MFHKPEKKYWFIYLLIAIAATAIIIWPNPSEASGGGGHWIWHRISGKYAAQMSEPHVDPGSSIMEKEHINLEILKAKPRFSRFTRSMFKNTSTRNVKVNFHIRHTHNKKTGEHCFIIRSKLLNDKYCSKSYGAAKNAAWAAMSTAAGKKHLPGAIINGAKKKLKKAKVKKPKTNKWKVSGSKVSLLFLAKTINFYEGTKHGSICTASLGNVRCWETKQAAKKGVIKALKAQTGKSMPSGLGGALLKSMTWVVAH